MTGSYNFYSSQNSISIIRVRRMKQAKLVVRVADNKNTYIGILIENVKERDVLEEFGVDGRTVFNLLATDFFF